MSKKEYIVNEGGINGSGTSSIGLSKHELSKIINGRRKLNNDLALKIGNTFDINPSLWIDIQNKNELFLLKNENDTDYRKYKLENLLSEK